MWPINKQKCLSAPKLVPFEQRQLNQFTRVDGLKRLGLRTNVYSYRNASLWGVFLQNSKRHTDSEGVW